MSTPTPRDAKPRPQNGNARPNAERPRQPEPDPAECRMLTAGQVQVGDRVWLWKMPSSPLPPGWYEVAAVTEHGPKPAAVESTRCLWLTSGAGGRGPMPHLFGAEHSLMSHRPDGWPDLEPEPDPEPFGRKPQARVVLDFGGLSLTELQARFGFPVTVELPRLLEHLDRITKGSRDFDRKVMDGQASVRDELQANADLAIAAHDHRLLLAAVVQLLEPIQLTTRTQETPV